MKCVLYARVSTDKQADKELSIPAQLAAMREYAVHRNWQILKEYIEPGASARTADRPVLQAMLSACKKDDERPQIVLVHKIDRLARNIYDHATIKALLQQLEIRLVSVVENVDDTVSGQLIENIMASIAQFYSGNLSEEVKKGMRQKVLTGGWPHKAPRGYVSIATKSGPGRHLEVHPREGPLIRKAFELYGTGHYSVKALAARLAKDGVTARGGRPLAVSYIRRLLTKVFYTGRIHWGGLAVQGTHPPLISPELFQQVQRVIAEKYRNSGVKGSVRGFPLRGTAICASCRSRMTGERRQRWSYYRCGRNAAQSSLCPASFCSTKNAHADLERVLRSIYLNRELAESITRACQDAIRARIDSVAATKLRLDGELRDLLRTEMQLSSAFAAGDVSPKVFRTKTQRIRESRQLVERRIDTLKMDPKILTTRVTHTIQLATTMLDIYETFSDIRQAEVIRSLFSTIVLSRTGIAGFTLHSPFQQLVEASTGDEMPIARDHPSELIDSILDSAA